MDFVFDIWPTVAEMARETGYRYQTVNSWKARKSIPVHAFPVIVEAAARRGTKVSMDRLVSARARDHERREAS
ncbi:MAG: hypothetical protein AAGF50_08515 [Pseudomonadota bacterium]